MAQNISHDVVLIILNLYHTCRHGGVSYFRLYRHLSLIDFVLLQAKKKTGSDSIKIKIRIRPVWHYDTIGKNKPGKLPRLLISWLQSPSAVILETPKIKSDTISHGFPICLP